MKANILLLPGDGIGPEVVTEARRVLDTAASRFGHAFTFDTQLIGGAAIDDGGDPFPKRTLDACERADAILLGAVGGPKWDDPRAKTRPEQGLLALRRSLGLFANLRPVRPHPALAAISPVKPERIEGADILFVRELTGGLYFGPRGRDRRGVAERAFDTLEYTDVEIRRVIEVAFQLARGRKKRVTSVDKANVLESSRMWREIAIDVASKNPDIALDHQLVDSCAMRLITAPRSFDVLVTENMFGDILTDEAAVLAGTLGMLPSASIGATGGDRPRGVYEPIHGSAPDIAGKGLANPVGTILSAAMMLRHSLGLDHEARAIERAVDAAIADGARTADMSESRTTALSTQAMAAAVCAALMREAVPM